MISERYYSFNKYLREVFGERVHRISLDAGFSCPNIDGKISKEGCIYCNNKAFNSACRNNGEDTFPLNQQIEDIRQQIKSSIEFYNKKFKVKKFIAYFQSFSNTYADVQILRRKYDVIKEFPQIVGLFISTRPDCIDEQKLKLISSYRNEQIKLVWIEYGLQTTNNDILKFINRGHNYENFLSAVFITKKYNIQIGTHLILGLPGQNILEDVEKISALPIDGIKFHLLHVLKDTPLEKIYYKGEISLLSEKEYVQMLCDCLERLRKDIVILRLVSTADEKFLVAPKWMNNKHKIISEIQKELERRDSFQGKYCSITT